MITVSVKRDQLGSVRAFTVVGHADYAQHGEDIVCAGVSAIVQTTILGLQEVLSIDCDGSQKSGRLTCHLPQLAPPVRREADIVLETMLAGLKAMAAIYTDFIQILETTKEV